MQKVGSSIPGQVKTLPYRIDTCRFLARFDIIRIGQRLVGSATRDWVRYQIMVLAAGLPEEQHYIYSPLMLYDYKQWFLTSSIKITQTNWASNEQASYRITSHAVYFINNHHVTRKHMVHPSKCPGWWAQERAININTRNSITWLSVLNKDG